jgi:hypothetical protein
LRCMPERSIGPVSTVSEYTCDHPRLARREATIEPLETGSEPS